MKYVKWIIILPLLFPFLMILNGCGGGDVSGDGMETGSFLTVEVFGRIDDCSNSGYAYEAGYNCQCIRLAHAFFFNHDLPFQPNISGDTEEPGLPEILVGITVVPFISQSDKQNFNLNAFPIKNHYESITPVSQQQGETGSLPTSRYITIDRYTVEYIPSDSISPPLSSREFFQTIQIPPSTDIGYEIIFMDLNTKEEFESFVEQNPNILRGNYTAVFRFYGHNDLGAEVSVAASNSFVIGRLENCAE